MASFLSLSSSAAAAVFFFFLYCSVLTAAGAGEPSELVKKVCNQTTDYKFCVDSLDSNPNTPGYDEIGIASLAFSLASINATNTKSYIEGVLKNSTVGSISVVYRKCLDLYGPAAESLVAAGSEIDGENYDLLAGYAEDAAHKIRACDDAIGGSVVFSALRRRNRDLRQLIKISAVSSSLISPEG